MVYTRPTVENGKTKLDKAFVDNLLDGIEESPTFADMEDAVAQAAASPVPLRAYMSDPRGTDLSDEFEYVTVSESATPYVSVTDPAVADLFDYTTVQASNPALMYGGSFWQNAATGEEAASPMVVTFGHDEDHFTLVGVSFGYGDVKVYADGKPYTLKAQGHKVPFGSYVMVDVKMKTKRHRVFEVVVGTAAVRSVLCEKSASIYPAPRPAVKLAVVGDSWVAGADVLDGGGVVAGSAMPEYLRIATGLEVWNMGIGGTGYVNPGANTPYGSAVRLDRLVAANPDVVVVVGSVNDFGSTRAEIEAAATAYFAALESHLPGVPVIVVGAEPLAYEETLYTKCNDAVRTAANAARNVVEFIDWRVERWFTYGGKAGDPTGTGNTDRFMSHDGIHPSEEGNQYLGFRLRVAIEKVRVLLKL